MKLLIAMVCLLAILCIILFDLYIYMTTKIESMSYEIKKLKKSKIRTELKSDSQSHRYWHEL